MYRASCVSLMSGLTDRRYIKRNRKTARACNSCYSTALNWCLIAVKLKTISETE